MMNDQAKPYQQIIAKCWADDAFKQKLMADPSGTLKQEGVEIPSGVSVSVHENTETQVNLVIPMKPNAVRDEELGGVAGGMSYCCLCFK